MASCFSCEMRDDVEAGGEIFAQGQFPRGGMPNQVVRGRLRAARGREGGSSGEGSTRSFRPGRYSKREGSAHLLDRSLLLGGELLRRLVLL